MKIKLHYPYLSILKGSESFTNSTDNKFRNINIDFNSEFQYHRGEIVEKGTKRILRHYYMWTIRLFGFGITING